MNRSPVTSASPELESHAGFSGNTGPLVLPSFSLFPLLLQALLQFVLGERQPLLQDRNGLRWEDEKEKGGREKRKREREGINEKEHNEEVCAVSAQH